MKFKDKNVTRWPMHRRARLGIGYLTQEPSVFRKLTVQQNILAILETCRISRQELLIFNQELATLLKAGMPLVQSLDILRQRVSNPTYLRAQMQAYVACEDPEIREVVRRGFGELVEYVERATGLPPEAVAQAFAHAMLLNVVAAMHLDEAPESWAERLLEGSKRAG